MRPGSFNSSLTMSLKAKAVSFHGLTLTNPNPNEIPISRTVDLKQGSQIVYVPSFLSYDDSWKCFHYLNNEMPWSRPTLFISGKTHLQGISRAILQHLGCQNMYTVDIYRMPMRGMIILHSSNSWEAE